MEDCSVGNTIINPVDLNRAPKTLSLPLNFKGDTLYGFSEQLCRTRVVFTQGGLKTGRLHRSDISVHCGHSPNSEKNYSYPLLSVDFNNRRKFVGEPEDAIEMPMVKFVSFRIGGYPGRPVTERLHSLSRCQQVLAILQEFMGIGFEYTELGHVYCQVLENDVGEEKTLVTNYLVRARNESQLVESIQMNAQQPNYDAMFQRFMLLVVNHSFDFLGCLEDLVKTVHEVSRRISISGVVDEFSVVFQLNNFFRKRLHEFLETCFKKLASQSASGRKNELYHLASLYARESVTCAWMPKIPGLLQDFIRMVAFYSKDSASWSAKMSWEWPLHNFAEKKWMDLGCMEPAPFFSRVFQQGVQRTEQQLEHYLNKTVDGLVPNSTEYRSPLKLNDPIDSITVSRAGLRQRLHCFSSWYDSVPISIRRDRLSFSWDTFCVSVAPRSYDGEPLFANAGYANFPVPETYDGNRMLGRSEYSSSVDRMDFVFECGTMDFYEMNQLRVDLRLSRNAERILRKENNLLLDKDKQSLSEISALTFESHGLREDDILRQKELADSRVSRSMEFNDVTGIQLTELEGRMDATGSVYEACRVCGDMIIPGRAVTLHCQSSSTSGVLIGHPACGGCFVKDCTLKLAEFEQQRPHEDPRKRTFQYTCPFDKQPVSSISVAVDSGMCPEFQKRLASFLKSPVQVLPPRSIKINLDIEAVISEIAFPVTPDQMATFGNCPSFQSMVIANQAVAAGFRNSYRELRGAVWSSRQSSQAMVRAYEVASSVPGLLQILAEDDVGDLGTVDVLPVVSNQQGGDTSMETV